jgi:DedD protein
MENRLRDLEFIQERDTDDRGRRIGIVLLATLTLIGLTFAMGVVVGRAAKSEDSEIKDPLADLDRTRPIKAREAEPGPKPPKINREELTFPIALTEEDDRPEVAAALAAAAAEEAALAGLEDQTSDHPELPKQEVNASLPASVVVGSSNDNIKRTAKHDPLVKAAIQESENKSPAPSGREGEYTLQVISYDKPEPARAFAEGLRARGHQAYVVNADIPGRGRYYRVRIGPFPSKWKANIYQRQFEEAERMSTYIVQKRREEG